MKAFRYLASHWIDTLRDRRFKLSKPSELNDPFDCVMVYTGKPTREVVEPFLDQVLQNMRKSKLREGISPDEVERLLLENREAIRERMREDLITFTSHNARLKTNADKVMRLLCMTIDKEPQTQDELLSEILMWSHYTNKHKGIRIGINLDAIKGGGNEIHSVNYSDNPPVCDLSKGLLGPDVNSALITTVTTKSRAWKYENEIRLFNHPERCLYDRTDSGDMSHFLTFTPDCIYRVDFGLVMSPIEQEECITLLSKDYPHVVAYKACYHKTDYRLKYEPLITPK